MPSNESPAELLKRSNGPGDRNVDNPEKGLIKVTWQEGQPPETIPVQFYPTEISLEKGAQIAEVAIPGLDSPLLQFVHGQNEKMKKQQAGL